MRQNPEHAGHPKGGATTPEASEALDPATLRALGDARAYPDDPSAAQGVEWVQTHLSHVFLTRARVYKLRKAVDLGFVRFATRAERNADCLREVRLNRRLAPDVYLGVAPVLGSGASARVGRAAEELASVAGSAPEHCVVMRRLPAGRDALSLLERHRLRAAHLERVAETVAAFHDRESLGRPAPFAPKEWVDRIRGPVEANLEALRAAAEDAARDVRVLARRAEEAFERLRDRFEERRRGGSAVDGHGDLHLQHVWFEADDSAPLLIDCIEFREDLRRIDAAADVAFLAMDLRYRRRSRLAERFLRHYARERDDFDLYGVLDYFVSYRAAVRAKVAAIAAQDRDLPEAQRKAATESARRHLRLAVRALSAPRPGGIALLCGVVGTGKTTVAEHLANHLDGVAIASDRVRKRLAGLSPLERAPERAYTPERTREVYRGLLERADPVVRSGRFAILDATYAKEALRREALAWARERGLPVRVIEARCARDTALERLARRAALRQDASDAGPELYARSVAGFEPVGETPLQRVVHTDRPGWRRRVQEIARELRRVRRTAPRSP